MVESSLSHEFVVPTLYRSTWCWHPRLRVLGIGRFGCLPGAPRTTMGRRARLPAAHASEAFRPAGRPRIEKEDPLAVTLTGSEGSPARSAGYLTARRPLPTVSWRRISLRGSSQRAAKCSARLPHVRQARVVPSAQRP